MAASRGPNMDLAVCSRSRDDAPHGGFHYRLDRLRFNPGSDQCAVSTGDGTTVGGGQPGRAAAGVDPVAARTFAQQLGRRELDFIDLATYPDDLDRVAAFMLQAIDAIPKP